MPELPEVETVRRGLEPVMVGQRFSKVTLRRANLRFPFPLGMARKLEGKRVEALSRRAKYIIGRIEGGDLLLMHLGMSGRFTIHLPKDEDKRSPGRFHHQIPEVSPDGTGRHDHVVFDMEDGSRIVYTDHRRFGIMDLFSEDDADEHKLLKQIGVEPLGNELTGAYLNEVLRNRKSPLKTALLDQKIIAGLGNIYACEVLHRAGLSPLRLAHTISAKRGPTDRIERLVQEVRAVLSDAIDAGGSTLRDYAHTDGELGYFQHTFRVYDQEGENCPKAGCPGRIEHLVQSGRSTFYCRRCQK